MSEMPLHVQVAEAIGWEWWVSSDTGRRCLYAPGENPGWMRERAKGHEPLVGDWDSHIQHRVPRYDTDWSAAGLLIERYGLTVGRDVSVEPARWRATRPGYRWLTSGDHPLEAVCDLVLTLAKAGELA